MYKKTIQAPLKINGKIIKGAPVSEGVFINFFLKKNLDKNLKKASWPCRGQENLSCAPRAQARPFLSFNVHSMQGSSGLKKDRSIREILESVPFVKNGKIFGPSLILKGASQNPVPDSKQIDEHGKFTIKPIIVNQTQLPVSSQPPLKINGNIKRGVSFTELNQGAARAGKVKGERIPELQRVELKKFKPLTGKQTEIKLITIGLASPTRIRQWAEKTLPGGKVVGEVTNAETLHYKTFKPIKGGLFCERIFGPIKDHECACGKKFNIKLYLNAVQNQHKTPEQSAGWPLLNLTEKLEGGPENNTLIATNNIAQKQPIQQILALKQKRYFCNVCDVEYTYSTIRRTQLGYINLATPVTHIWFVKGVPNYMSILLDMKKRDLQNVIYNFGVLTLENSLKGKQLVTIKPADLYQTWAKVAKTGINKNVPGPSLNLPLNLKETSGNSGPENNKGKDSKLLAGTYVPAKSDLQREMEAYKKVNKAQYGSAKNTFKGYQKNLYSIYKKQKKAYNLIKRELEPARYASSFKPQASLLNLADKKGRGFNSIKIRQNFSKLLAHLKNLKVNPLEQTGWLNLLPFASTFKISKIKKGTGDFTKISKNTGNFQPPEEVALTPLKSPLEKLKRGQLSLRDRLKAFFNFYRGSSPYGTRSKSGWPLVNLERGLPACYERSFYGVKAARKIKKGELAGTPCRDDVPPLKFITGTSKLKLVPVKAKVTCLKNQILKLNKSLAGYSFKTKSTGQMPLPILFLTLNKHLPNFTILKNSKERWNNWTVLNRVFNRVNAARYQPLEGLAFSPEKAGWPQRGLENQNRVRSMQGHREQTLKTLLNQSLKALSGAPQDVYLPNKQISVIGLNGKNRILYPIRNRAPADPLLLKGAWFRKNIVPLEKSFSKQKQNLSLLKFKVAVLFYLNIKNENPVSGQAGSLINKLSPLLLSSHSHFKKMPLKNSNSSNYKERCGLDSGRLGLDRDQPPKEAVVPTGLKAKKARFSEKLFYALFESVLTDINRTSNLENRTGGRSLTLLNFISHPFRGAKGVGDKAAPEGGWSPLKNLKKGLGVNAALEIKKCRERLAGNYLVIAKLVGTREKFIRFITKQYETADFVISGPQSVQLYRDFKKFARCIQEKMLINKITGLSLTFPGSLTELKLPLKLKNLILNSYLELPFLKGQQRLRKRRKVQHDQLHNNLPLIVNNLYCFSHRHVWTDDQEKNWRRFTLYFYPPKDFNAKSIPIYKYRNYDEIFNFDENLKNTLNVLNNVGQTKTNNTPVPSLILKRYSQNSSKIIGKIKRNPALFPGLKIIDNGLQRSSGGLPSNFSPNFLRGQEADLYLNGMNINTTFSGAGIIQKLLNEFNLSELKKMDKQNRILLFEFNKQIKRLKKMMTPPASFFAKQKSEALKTSKRGSFNSVKGSLKSRLEYYKACHTRDIAVRRTKLIRKILNNASGEQADGLNMILTVLPVLPPDLRPIVKTNGKQATADVNTFYKNIIYRNERLKKFLKDPALNSSFEMKYAQRLVQEAVDNLIQNGKGGVTPVKDARGRLLKSLSEALKGKQGRFRQYLLGKRVDYSARSVIVVAPSLKLHQCGIPKEIALTLYFPFLIKRILNQKLALTVPGAKGLIQKRSPLIWQLLREIMKTCPVLLNRAPTLHRLGFQAFQPKLVEGKAILLHPLVCPAFNADFDGDQMAVHIPITPEAKAEAWQLMLSRNNLLSPATGEPLILPSQDMVLGCYYLTTNCSEKFRKFKKGYGMYFHSILDVMKAYNQQIIDLHALIWVNMYDPVNGRKFNSNHQEQPLEIRISLTFLLESSQKASLPNSSSKPLFFKIKRKTVRNYKADTSVFNANSAFTGNSTIIIYPKLHQIYNCNGELVSQIIRTTTGKIVFNNLCEQAFSKRPKLLK